MAKRSKTGIRKGKKKVTSKPRRYLSAIIPILFLLGAIIGFIMMK